MLHLALLLVPLEHLAQFLGHIILIAKAPYLCFRIDMVTLNLLLHIDFFFCPLLHPLILYYFSFLYVLTLILYKCKLEKQLVLTYTKYLQTLFLKLK
jgi:hypothetical protein